MRFNNDVPVFSSQVNETVLLSTFLCCRSGQTVFWGDFINETDLRVIHEQLSCYYSCRMRQRGVGLNIILTCNERIRIKLELCPFRWQLEELLLD